MISKKKLKKMTTLGIVTIIISIIAPSIPTVFAETDTEEEISAEARQKNEKQIKDPLSLLSKIEGSTEEELETDGSGLDDTQSSSEQEMPTTSNLDSSEKSQLDNSQSSSEQEIPTTSNLESSEESESTAPKEEKNIDENAITMNETSTKAVYGDYVYEDTGTTLQTYYPSGVTVGGVPAFVEVPVYRLIGFNGSGSELEIPATLPIKAVNTTVGGHQITIAPDIVVGKRFLSSIGKVKRLSWAPPTADPFRGELIHKGYVEDSDLSRTFYSNTNLLSVDFTNTLYKNSVRSTASMFEYCTKLQMVTNPPNGAETSARMFSMCSNLEQIITLGDEWQLDGSVGGLFNGCTRLTQIATATSTAVKLTGSISGSAANMFSGCSSLKTVNLSQLDVRFVTDMSNMFMDTSLPNLDLTNFNTTNVTDMSRMFYSNYYLKSLDLSNFNTANVTDMELMFGMTFALTNLDLTNFNMTNVTNMSKMFYSTSRIPLLVITDSPSLLMYGYADDNRYPPSITFLANYGQFSDGSTIKNYISSCTITPAQATISEFKKYMNNTKPTRIGYIFESWECIYGTDVDNASSVTSLLGSQYKAKWRKPAFGITKVPSPKTFNSALNTGTLTVSSSETTNKVTVVDESNASDGWKLTAQLIWTSIPMANTTLKTKSTGNVEFISPSGGSTPASPGLITSNSNIEIADTPRIVLDGKDGVQPFCGKYETDLKDMSLKISDGSKVRAGTYNGNINWNLISSP